MTEVNLHKRWNGEIIQPRGSVTWFSWHMEAKLQKKDYKGGWSDLDDIYLFALLQEEMAELLHAIAEGAAVDRVIDEAVDVANIAHMLADNAERRRAG
jgi:NTP pyrophosphatase (non-canonical NTP hydrolase)